MKSQQVPSTPNPPRLTARRKLALLAFGFVVFLALLGVAELLVRLFGAGQGAHEDPFFGFEPGLTLFARERLADGSEVYRTRPSKLAWFNEQSFAAVKPAGSLRVFALGGSTTFGRPYDDKVSFAAWTRRLLDEMEPNRRHEVINAGGISYASYRIVLLMRELVAYQPDLFVVYTGHNEFLEERTYGEIKHEPALQRLLRKSLNHLASYRALRTLVAPKKPADTLAADVTTRLDVWAGMDAFHRDEVLSDQVLNHFAINLQTMVDIAREAGAEIVFVNPVANVKDFSPFKSQHTAGLDATAKMRFLGLFAEGRKLQEQGHDEEAVRAFVDASRIDPEYAELHFRLGRSLLVLGRNSEARVRFDLARELDVCPLRCPEQGNLAIRTVCGRNHIPLIDLAATLEADCRARFGHDCLGNEYFLDHVHPDMQVHFLIAQQLIDLLAARGTIAVAPAGAATTQAAIFERVKASLDADYYAQRDLNLAKVLGWAGKYEEASASIARAAGRMQGNPAYHYNAGILHEKLGRFQAALDEYEQAIALQPDLFEAYFNRGKSLLSLARYEEAVAAFQQALTLKPGYAEIHYNLAVCHLALGRLEEALAHIEPAGDWPGIDSVRAEIYQRQGDADGAVRAYEQALAHQPQDAGAHYDLGVVLARRGDYARAKVLFEKTVQLQPDFSQAYRNLALIHRNEGRPQQALDAYRQAAAAVPGDPLAAFDLAAYLHHSGRITEAVVGYRRVLELNPRFIKAYNNLGAALGELGERDEAIVAFRQAIALEPDNAESHYNLGQFLLARGDRDEAVRHLDRAAALGMAIPAEIREKLLKAGGDGSAPK